MNDTDRAAGRTGLGAVMGAKNVKAIAIRGTGRVTLADPKRFREFALADLAKIRTHPWLGDSPGSAGALGTAGGVEDLSRAGICQPATGRRRLGVRRPDQRHGYEETILLGTGRVSPACWLHARYGDGPFSGSDLSTAGPSTRLRRLLMLSRNQSESIALPN
jgi:hypothetical protein